MQAKVFRDVLFGSKYPSPIKVLRALLLPFQFMRGIIFVLHKILANTYPDFLMCIKSYGYPPYKNI